MIQYKIFALDEPEHLQRTEYEGYGRYKTIRRSVLKKLDIDGVKDTHPSIEEAANEIKRQSEKLKSMELTIIPVITIDWEGTVS